MVSAPEVVPNIPVGQNRNGLSISLQTEISGKFGLMESTR